LLITSNFYAEELYATGAGEGAVSLYGRDEQGRLLERKKMNGNSSNHNYINNVLFSDLPILILEHKHHIPIKEINLINVK